MTGTKWRAQFTTMWQLLDAKPHEYKWFCDHLGHSKAVNEEYYKKPIAMIELNTMAPLLHASLDGTLKNFKVDNFQL